VTDTAPRFTRLDYDERRGQILGAARRLFTKRRYSDVAMKDIAEAAGVTRGLLSYYFDSKHDLYLEVARDMLRLPMLPLPTDEGTSKQLWARSVDAWLDMIDANREDWLTAVRAGENGHDPQIRAIQHETSELMVERVLQLLRLDEGATPELRAVVRAYGGLAQEATREWLERGRLSRSQVRALLVGVMPLIARELLPEILNAAD
jgi:AcrR family transcriptional regulator